MKYNAKAYFSSLQIWKSRHVLYYVQMVWELDAFHCHRDLHVKCCSHMFSFLFRPCSDFAKIFLIHFISSMDYSSSCRFETSVKECREWNYMHFHHEYCIRKLSGSLNIWYFIGLHSHMKIKEIWGFMFIWIKQQAPPLIFLLSLNL